ncbi:pentatricopeptide repeat-containing protein At4g22760 [Mercurialis annua]|uniref:pentatricopeptide repeat-containing protein At4g22760 n=1 Tax=Mercurialis annua TaxID=3986 RepID=UPI00215F180D|nr:pentatricopeptide repeat-containing protein At4g22760 [Mercurialis annua]
MLPARLTTILNNCPSANQAKQIHAQIVVNSLNKLEPLLVRQILVASPSYTKIVSQYVENILFHLRDPETFSWGCTVRYFSQQGQFEKALSLYREMVRQGLCPSTYAISSSLRACARILHNIGGISIHAQCYKFGFCGCVYVQTALVDLYSKLGDMNSALKVFDDTVEKNVVSWNSILSGYLKSGKLEQAQSLFDQIPMKDIVSWNSMVSGYASNGDMDQACLLFQQMPERNYASWNAMISGYVDCGNIESAQGLFDAMPQRNNISWITLIAGYSKYGNVESAWILFNRMLKKDRLSYNAMISCFAQNNQPNEALKLFNEMRKSDNDVQPDKMTIVSVLSACSQLGDLRQGSWIESYIKNVGIEFDDHLVTAFIDLYAKCGNVDKAYDLFHCLKKKDVVAYSAIIFGCGINGKVADAVKLFGEMMTAQIKPNLVTFTGLLTAYNHAGLIEEAYRCFKSMTNHQLVPLSDHYAIMVDLLGRAGRLQEAYEFIKSMPMQPYADVWGALLLACEVHSNVEFGELAARRCFELEPATSAYYSLLANVYASVGRWDDAKRLRKAVKKKKLVKLPGCSWTEST